MNNGIKVILLVISIALILFAVNEINDVLKYQDEERKINELDENEIDAEAIITGEGSEKGLVRVEVILNNSKGIITNAEIRRIYDAYEINNAGHIEYYAGGKSEFSQLKPNLNNNNFSTEFEIPKNKKYAIYLSIESSWNQVNKAVEINTWQDGY